MRVQGVEQQNWHRFTSFLLNWFSDNKRVFPWRVEKDPYKILIAEKMLQQTTYGHVLNVYEIFLEKYPNISSLSQASTEEVERLIKPLGFQKQRSKQLVNLSNQVISYHHGDIPTTKESLLALDGVGEYIANAMLCFAFSNDVPIIDVNVRRVLGRAFGWVIKDKELYENINLILPKGFSRDFNWAIIDFSSIVCSRKPKCSLCLYKGYCSYFRTIGQ